MVYNLKSPPTKKKSSKKLIISRNSINVMGSPLSKGPLRSHEKAKVSSEVTSEQKSSERVFTRHFKPRMERYPQYMSSQKPPKGSSSKKSKRSSVQRHTEYADSTQVTCYSSLQSPDSNKEQSSSKKNSKSGSVERTPYHIRNSNQKNSAIKRAESSRMELKSIFCSPVPNSSKADFLSDLNPPRPRSFSQSSSTLMQYSSPITMQEQEEGLRSVFQPKLVEKSIEGKNRLNREILLDNYFTRKKKEGDQ